MLTHDRIADIAESYTAAWNSGSAAAMAEHYAADGGIVINRGAPRAGAEEHAGRR